jgi:phosphate transport system substrate-binding protein
MKKIIFVTFACIFALTMMVACGGDTPDTSDQANEPQTEQTTNQDPPDTPAPEPEPQPEPEPASNFDDNREITVISREPGSGTRGAFVELTGVEVSEDGNTTDMTYEEAVISSGTNAVMTNVAGDTYAIGYISTGSVNDTIKTVSIDGVEPTSANILAGDYEISRPFIIVTLDNLSPVAQDFIDFIMSKEGQEIIGGSYIPVDQNAPDFESNRATGTVVVGGSTSVAPVMESLAEAYLAINTDANIEIHATGSGAGISGAIEGVLDIGMSSRNIRDSEMDELHQEITIAMDGIAVIVNNDNPLSNLTMEQVREIFVGEKTRWSQVG